MEYEYGLKTIKALDKCELNKWYAFSQAKDKQEELLEVVKLRIDLSCDFKISNDYKCFKRIEVPAKQQNPNYTGEITYTIDFSSHLVQLPYDHLPEPKYTPENKIVKRRAQ